MHPDCVEIANGLTAATSCIGERVVYNCTVQSPVHVWTVSTSNVNPVTVSRGTPLATRGDFRFEFVEVSNNRYVSSLSVLASAGLDGADITCDDSLNPGQGLLQEAMATVLGIQLVKGSLFVCSYVCIAS